jgi:thiol-disulfide isomerase/thioredoxin
MDTKWIPNSIKKRYNIHTILPSTPIMNNTTPITTATLAEFQSILQKNTGGVLLKLSAEWCGPCKRIQPLVLEGLSVLPDTVLQVIIDIDDSLELYTYLKNKRRINGIPAILFWKPGNISDIPDDFVLGGNADQVIALFNRIISFTRELSSENGTK